MSLDYDKIYNETKEKAASRLPLVLEMLGYEYLGTAKINDRNKAIILEYMTFHLLAEDNKQHGLYRTTAFCSAFPQRQKVQEMLNEWWPQDTKDVRTLDAIAAITEGKDSPGIEAIRQNVQRDLMDEALDQAQILFMDRNMDIGYGGNLLSLLTDKRVTALLSYIVESRLMNQLPERRDSIHYEELKRAVKDAYGALVLQDLIQVAVDEINLRMSGLSK